MARKTGIGWLLLFIGPAARQGQEFDLQEAAVLRLTIGLFAVGPRLPLPT